MNSLAKLNDRALLELSRVIILALPADNMDCLNKQELSAQHGFKTMTEFNKAVSVIISLKKQSLKSLD